MAKDDEMTLKKKIINVVYTLRNARKSDIARVAILCVLGISMMIFIRVAGGSSCIIKSLFGIPCPACGMTRSWVALFHGDLSVAFGFHPLFIVPVMVVGLFILFPRVRRNWYSPLLWVPVIILFVSVYAVRMYLYFPHTPPLDFNSHALLARLGRMILALI